jgi:hypothetical protein
MFPRLQPGWAFTFRALKTYQCEIDTYSACDRLAL